MSYITDYLITTEKSKPAKEFHIWTMLYTLSVFSGGRFWFPFGPLNFRTNLYVVHVGDPGNGKSTAMERGKDIVRASGVCPIAPAQISKEALAQKMSSTHEGVPKKVPFIGQRFFDYEGRKHEYNQYAIFADELTQFIGVNPLGFIEFFTAAWTQKVIDVDTKNKGCDLINGPYITLLACMTPDIVKGYLKMNILSSGFARRTAFVFTNHQNIVPWPEYTNDQRAAEARCVAFGKDLQRFCGPFSITDECKEFYFAWNQDNEERKRQRTPATRGWFETKPEMLFKLSMLIALAEGEAETRVIHLPYYKMALHFCSLLEAQLDRVFEGCGVNPNANVANQICRMLEGLDRPMPKKKLQAMFGDQATSWRELTDTIAHLCTVGRLTEQDIKAGQTILGTLISTPATMARYTLNELAAFLVPSQPMVLDMDSSSPERPPVVLRSQPEGSVGEKSLGTPGLGSLSDGPASQSKADVKPTLLSPPQGSTPSSNHTAPIVHEPDPLPDLRTP